MIACSGGDSTHDGLDGAIDAILDAEAGDARAQEDGGGGGACGACTVTGPIDVRLPDAPLRVITADTDPAQLEGGFYAASPTTYATLALGPFVLTDASSNGGRGSGRTDAGVCSAQSSCEGDREPWRDQLCARGGGRTGALPRSSTRWARAIRAPPGAPGHRRSATQRDR